MATMRTVVVAAAVLAISVGFATALDATVEANTDGSLRGRTLQQ